MNWQKENKIAKSSRNREILVLSVNMCDQIISQNGHDHMNGNEKETLKVIELKQNIDWNKILIDKGK